VCVDISMIFSPVQLGKNVVVFPHVVLGRPPLAPAGTILTEIEQSGKPVIIGDNTVIGCGVVIYENVIIGKNCLIGDNAVIREKTVIGNNSIIGIGTHVGANVKVGNYTRILELSQMAGNSIIGDNVFIAPGFYSSNDNTFGKEKIELYGVTIENNVCIGIGCRSFAGVVIGANSIVGANSLITKDIPSNVKVFGSPVKIK